VVGDATDPATVGAAMSAARATGRPVTALAYVAFAQPNGPLVEASMDDFDRAYRAGPLGAWQWSVAFAAAVPPDQPAAIALIGSVHALRAVPGSSAYAMAKSALHALGRALAVELGPRGIRANVVAPGYIAVERNARLRATAEGRAELEARNPLGILGRPEDVAAAVSFLCSDQARFVNGVCLSVDGGSAAAGWGGAR
jgi:NAD(P)-dependent dehydrogenase (short-subunit alcohol dehydrogenase family)